MDKFYFTLTTFRDRIVQLLEYLYDYDFDDVTERDRCSYELANMIYCLFELMDLENFSLDPLYSCVEDFYHRFKAFEKLEKLEENKVE